MPIINLKISTANEEKNKQSIADEITRLTVLHLKKKESVTAITIVCVEPCDWFIAKKSLADLGQNSFYLDIKITDGTNLKDEKKDFVQAVFDYMASVLPHLHAASYVYVEEVNADAYGFGGKTQEFRYVKSQLE